MLKRFLVPEKDQVMVSEADARAATEAIFVKMGLPEDDAVPVSYTHLTLPTKRIV